MFWFHQRLPYLEITWNENLSRMERSPFMNSSGKDWQILCTRKRGSQEHSFRTTFILNPDLVTILLWMNAEYDFIFLPTSSDYYVEQKLTERNILLKLILELFIFKCNIELLTVDCSFGLYFWFWFWHLLKVTEP